MVFTEFIFARCAIIYVVLHERLYGFLLGKTT